MRRMRPLIGAVAALFLWAGAGHAVVINEINADPFDDANGDGVVDSIDDEFVELVNEGSLDVDISGWTLSDALLVRHVFPPGSYIPPQGCLVVFAGGIPDPTGTPAGSFGGAILQVSSTGSLSLNNSGDTVTLSDGVVVMAEYTYGPEAANNQSVTLDPDVIGSPPMVPHGSAVGSAGTISPGLTVAWTAFPNADFYCWRDADGDGYGDPGDMISAEPAPAGYVKNAADCDDTDETVHIGAPELVDGQDNDCDGYLLVEEIDGDGDGYVPGTIDPGGWDGVGTVIGDDCDDGEAAVHPDAEEACDGLDNDCDGAVDEGCGLIVNEINADPYDDANGDGLVDASLDEFVELVNGGPGDLDVSGWTLSDETGVRHVFPVGSIIPEQGCLVVFGGGAPDPAGTPAATFGGAVVQTASTGTLGLNNTGDSVTVADGGGPVAEAVYGAEGGNDQSLTLDPDVTGIPPLVPHTTAAGSAGSISPGLTVAWAAFPGSSLLCWRDADLDGYGDAADFVTAELPPAGYVKNAADCDDGDDTVFPGAEELVDGQDNDCDGYLIVDEIDADGDLYVPGVLDPGGWDGAGAMLGGEDCDDADASVHPDAVEACDGVDNDCDGDVDEGCNPFEILSVDDVGNDQGRQVRLTWPRLADLDPVGGNVIRHYSVFRRIDGNKRDPAEAAKALPPGEWDFVTSVPAYGEDVYHAVAPTLCDSTDAGVCWSVFLVRAQTDDPDVFTDTPPDSGYSIDNLAPSVPTRVVLSGGVLSWDECPDADFDYFSVYGSSEPELGPGATLIDFTTATNLDVRGTAHAYLLVTATDFSGNEGTAGVAAGPTAVWEIPAAFRLLGATPNPFNPATTIRFELPSRSEVELSVYDMSGRLVRGLLRGEMRAPGRHGIVWDGRDGTGRESPAGVYVYRLRAGGNAASGRVLLVK